MKCCKMRILLSLSLMILCLSVKSQNVIRVTNGQNIQNLIDTNPANTVFLLDPGVYSGFTVQKKISVIGSGYFNGANQSTINSDVVFSSTNVSSSAGSYITGCSISTVTLNADNIMVQKCRMYSTNSGLLISDAINNCIIQQCYVDRTISINNNPVNFKIINCLVGYSISFSNQNAQISGLVENNTVGWGLNITCNPLQFGPVNNSVIIRNNIFVSPNTCISVNTNTTYFAVFGNNVFRQGNYSTNNSTNIQLTNLETLFTGNGTGGLELSYQLSPTSPARAVGTNGIDCGAFGGTQPYIVSGTPTGPVIYELTAPTTARQNETIQVQIKAKIQN